MDDWYAEHFDPQTELHVVPTLSKGRARPRTGQPVESCQSLS